MTSRISLRTILVLVAVSLLAPVGVFASHISGIRISQTGNTGLQIDVDVTAFYVTSSTETTAYLGTYYNQVPAVDWGDGSTVPGYGYGPSTGIPLVATSTVVNGIPARAYRGSFSHTYGSAGNYTISAQTTCCPLTTPTYTLVTGTIRTTTFTTSTPFSTAATITTSFVQNTLAVDAAAPAFSKVFVPDSTGAGVPSTLTFTIDNAASTLDDNNLAFVDNLPAGLVVASPANAATTCTGGTLTAASGSGTVSYSGGVVAAGASCTISLDVVSATAGVFVNTTGDLTSSFGNSGTASDTLSVNVAPTFSLSFSPDNIAPGDTSTLTFSIDNTSSAVAATALGFSTNLPAGMTVAGTRGAGGPNVVSTCTGGTVTAVAGSSLISYSGGTVAAGAVCTISVDVTISTSGPFTVDGGSLTTSLGSTAPGSAVAVLSTGPAIPTLSNLGLLLMAMILGLFAFLTLRRNRFRSQH